MAYIFLDESGDLGFDFIKKKTSKFFIVTCLFTESKTPIEKIVKKTHSELKLKHKRRFGVLHAVKEKPITRQRLLKRLSEKDCFIMTIYLNKNKVYTRLRDEKQVLYNSEEKTLQAVGFVSWAIFRKYEYADDTFYNIIKNRMVEENPLFP